MNHQVNLLLECLQQFQDTAFSRHDRVPDFKAIESVGNRLKEKYPIAFEDLQELFFACRDKNWWFEDYWELPQKNGPLEFSFQFCDLDETVEEQGIQELLSELKQIELVSIVLRFVRPDQYGILSPPVQRVLNVNWGSNAVETYLNYLRNLRKVQQEIGFDSVAEADMALWVLHAKCFGGEAVNKRFLEFFDTDPLLLSLRAQNLLGPFGKLPASVFARALETVRADLAAVVACYLFEIAIREKAKSLGSLWSGENELRIVLRNLKGKVDRQTSDRWYKLKEIRNELFHKNKKPSPIQTKDLIAEIEGIEKSLKDIRFGENEIP
ncbi:MAG: hypothetical protein KC592_11290 [Nitrospira sp.]|nr:hypothetical protein [Nitrospira sp.]